MGQGRKATFCYLHQVSAYLPYQLVYHPSHSGVENNKLVSVLPQPTGSCALCSASRTVSQEAREEQCQLPSVKTAFPETLSCWCYFLPTSCLGVRMMGGPGLNPGPGRNPWRHRELSGELVPGEQAS